MTICEYAIYRHAARLMTVAERLHALALAKQAETGDRMASMSLRELTLDVIADSENRVPLTRRLPQKVQKCLT